MTEDSPILVVDDASQPGRSRFLLADRVTIASARKLHEAALEASASGNDVAISCEAAEYLDASAIQVVLCLRRDLIGRGKKCEVVGVGEVLGKSLRLAGL